MAVIIAVVTRPRAVAWDTKSVSVVWSGAEEGVIPEGTVTVADGTSDGAHPGFKHDGFKLHYALQNNTDHDITIPQSVTIMQQLTKGGVLAPSRLWRAARRRIPSGSPAFQTYSRDGMGLR